MAVIVNTNTRQNPMTAAGQTGTQVVQFIDAPRVYIKSVDATPTPVLIKSAGTTPSGYTDLGIVDGKAKVTYDKSIKQVRTGIDNILRAEYVDKKTMTIEAHLSQFDDVVLSAISGVTASVLTAGSIVQFPIGTEDVVQKALLLVFDNKLDGKEWQFYNPNAYIKFTYADNGDATYVNLNCDLPAFAWPSEPSEAYVVQTIYA